MHGEYVGEFLSGLVHGDGTLTRVDGWQYDGKWEEDLPHGQGKLRYASETPFVGTFVHDTSNEPCVYTSDNSVNPKEVHGPEPGPIVDELETCMKVLGKCSER